jgi:hypothetical protein
MAVPTIVEAVRDDRLLGKGFRPVDTWSAWIVFLKAVFDLSMSRSEHDIYVKHAGRQARPTDPQESWLIVGRRGGKSSIAALVAVYLGCFRDYSGYLRPGEIASIIVVAADRAQSKTTLRYISGMLHTCPILKQLIQKESTEAITLSNRVEISVQTASFRTIRGRSVAAAICDEIAFWRDDSAAEPDSEILNAIRPSMGTIPGAKLICLSSPYGMTGELYRAYKNHYGKDDSPSLVWKAATTDMNPTMDQRIIDAAFRRDAASAATEWAGEFRKDLESYVSQEAVEAVTVSGRKSLPPMMNVRYLGFVDPSGGKADSMVLAIAHVEKNRVIVDRIDELEPPVSPERAVGAFVKIAREYRLGAVAGDSFSAEFVEAAFKRKGLGYVRSRLNKSDLYRELLPLINSEQIELLDSDRLKRQLTQLERRVTRLGRETIDHPPGDHYHDDVANAVAGASYFALQVAKSVSATGIVWGSEYENRGEGTPLINEQIVAIRPHNIITGGR